MTSGPEFPPALARRLTPEARARLRDWRDAHLVFGFTAEAERVWRANRVERLLSRNPPDPLLPLTASKFGGELYLEGPGDPPPGHLPLFQISFDDLRPRDDRLPGAGLLVFWEPVSPAAQAPPLVTRWYPAPDPERAVASPVRPRVLEARLRFRPRRFLPIPDEPAVAEVQGDTERAQPDPELARELRAWARHFEGREDDGRLEVLPAHLAGLSVAEDPEWQQENTALLCLGGEPAAGWRAPRPIVIGIRTRSLPDLADCAVVS